MNERLATGRGDLTTELSFKASWDKGNQFSAIDSHWTFKHSGQASCSGIVAQHIMDSTVSVCISLFGYRLVLSSLVLFQFFCVCFGWFSSCFVFGLILRNTLILGGWVIWKALVDGKNIIQIYLYLKNCFK